MSYGPNDVDMYQLAASYVNAFWGVKPGDISLAAYLHDAGKGGRAVPGIPYGR
jgi:hypothetical protein